MFRSYRIYLTTTGLLISTMTVAYAAEHVIGQKGKLFNPGVLTVKAGEVLKFENDDTVTHHVYSSTKGQEFSLDTLLVGKSGSHTFATKGRVDVRCGLHPGMRLIVTVQ
jgi:plastocyanin